MRGVRSSPVTAAPLDAAPQAMSPVPQARSMRRRPSSGPAISSSAALPAPILPVREQHGDEVVAVRDGGEQAPDVGGLAAGRRDTGAQRASRGHGGAGWAESTSWRVTEPLALSRRCHRIRAHPDVAGCWQPPRPVRARAPAWRGRDGRSLARHRHTARAQRRHQAASRRRHHRSGACEPLRAGGPCSLRAQSSQRLHDPCDGPDC